MAEEGHSDAKGGWEAGHSLPTPQPGTEGSSSATELASVSAPSTRADLPPILHGAATPELATRIERFYCQIDEAFERWVARRESPHTQRAYRGDVLSFVRFLGLAWPSESWDLLRVTVADVQRWRDSLIASGAASKTLNRRVSSVSSFYKYLGAIVAELRLPITVPNPAHAQFISRSSADPRKETRALTTSKARQLIGLPDGEEPIDYRDRAILKLYLFTGIRLATGCRLDVSDFHQEETGEATLRIDEKGQKRRTIGIHFVAAEAIRSYLDKTGYVAGPLFRGRMSSRDPVPRKTAT